ncbi:MAG: DUF1329 domain-containing protein [Candidatus Binataceae bacterium]
MTKKIAGVGALIVGMGLIAATAMAAGVKPGDVITPRNAAEVKNLVSPGVYYAIQHGMRMDIVAPGQIDWPPPYRDATEKYSSQVRLSDSHRSLVGYVAGQPFPLIDTNDPYVATKIMWNNVFRPIATDDADLRFFDCQSENVNPGKAQRVIDEIEIGHLGYYAEIGRTEVEPLPIDPDFKISNRMFLTALYPVLAPQSARGAGAIRYRYANPNRGDDSWAWIPGARRVRRLNEATGSTSVGAQTFDADHATGFDPKTEEYNYKFLGDRPMLASVHAKHSPEVTCPYDGGATACPENWEMRHMYVVSAMPRKGIGEAGDVVFGKTIVYMDSEAWFTPYVDTYDRKGQLWRSNIFWLTYRDRPVPDARVAIYPFKREFVVGASRFDVQSGFATMCYLPGQHTPERECWYINMGAVDKTFFTIDAMVRAAP